MDTPKSHLKILGPNGQPAAEGEGAPEEAPTPEAVQAEIALMMEDDKIKGFGTAMTLGAQLHAWGFQYLTRADYSIPAKQVLIDIIQNAMLLPDGSPRPFDEVLMDKHLNEEIIPFVTKQVKKHAKATRESQQTHDDTVEGAMKTIMNDQEGDSAKTDEPQVSE
jgi:hypothetical protein